MRNALSTALTRSLARSARSSPTDLRISQKFGRGACTDPRTAEVIIPQARGVPRAGPPLAGDFIWVNQHTVLRVSSGSNFETALTSCPCRPHHPPSGTRVWPACWSSRTRRRRVARRAPCSARSARSRPACASAWRCCRRPRSRGCWSTSTATSSTPTSGSARCSATRARRCWARHRCAARVAPEDLPAVLAAHRQPVPRASTSSPAIRKDGSRFRAEIRLEAGPPRRAARARRRRPRRHRARAHARAAARERGALSRSRRRGVRLHASSAATASSSSVAATAERVLGRRAPSS